MEMVVTYFVNVKGGSAMKDVVDFSTDVEIQEKIRKAIDEVVCEHTEGVSEVDVEIFS